MHKDRVLVTGANGLLGAHVVRELLRRKYRVRVLVRETSDLRALDGLNIELYKGQVTLKKDVEKALEGCRFLIHSAARTSPKPSGLAPFIKPNISSTDHCIEACKHQNIKRFVLVSTANCFGNGPLEDPGNEERPFMPWLKRSGYAFSKYLAQQKVLREANKNSLDAVVVNPTFIIGSHDVKPSSGQIIFHVVNKKVVFCPPGGKNFVDAETAAAGVVNAMEKGTKGECYLLAGENLSYTDFFKMVAGLTGQQPLRVPIPCFILMGLGYLGNFSEKILKIPVSLTTVNARMLCENNYYTPEKAIRELDLTFTPAKKAAGNALEWFRGNNYL